MSRPSRRHGAHACRSRRANPPLRCWARFDIRGVRRSCNWVTKRSGVSDGPVEVHPTKRLSSDARIESRHSIGVEHLRIDSQARPSLVLVSSSARGGRHTHQRALFTGRNPSRKRRQLLGTAGSPRSVAQERRGASHMLLRRGAPESVARREVGRQPRLHVERRRPFHPLERRATMPGAAAAQKWLVTIPASGTSSHRVARDCARRVSRAIRGARNSKRRKGRCCHRR